MAKILIIDDDQAICAMLSRMVQRMGHEAVCGYTLSEGIEAVSQGSYDVVFLDVRLPDGSGLEALPAFAGAPSSPEVIIITGLGDPDGAELAIRSGAWDYIQKPPSSLQNFTLPLLRALQYHEGKQSKGNQVGVLALKREGIIGDSPRMRACFELLAKVAGTESNLLITGETGTGKEVFASAVHKNSARCNKPFVVVDCSTLPETLVESIIFGYEKGAFSGADRARDGLIKLADGGTLFLDEVGELSLSIQKAFLRVLQERRFRPLGSKNEIASDFRLIAATNRDLKTMVEEGSFRSDLLFRLKSFTIELPPLRERSEDIMRLALHHVAKVCERQKVGVKGFSPDFIEALTAYHWPGNVRELFHALERALAAARYEATLFPKHLPVEIRVHLTRSSLSHSRPEKASAQSNSYHSNGFPTLRDYREEMDCQYLKDLLNHSGGDMKEACHISGLSRSRLYGLLKHHKISTTR